MPKQEDQKSKLLTLLRILEQKDRHFTCSMFQRLYRLRYVSGVLVVFDQRLRKNQKISGLPAWA